MGVPASKGMSEIESEIQWFGAPDYQVSNLINTGRSPLVGDVEIEIILSATKMRDSRSVAVCVEANYRLWRGDQEITDQRGIAPIFSLQQVREAALRWLQNHVG